MTTNNELWIPPQSPKGQKDIYRHNKNLRQTFLKWTGFIDKTLWDWLQILSVLAIPVVITASTLWFSAQQSESSSQASERQHQADLQIAKDQQEENALQTYLDRMSDLLLNSKLRESQPGDTVRNVARARTLTVLPQLNGKRKGELMRFLKEAGLINRGAVIVSLTGADLEKANLIRSNLAGADLSRSYLSRASLIGADLSYANLANTNLDGANLNSADLHSSDLSKSVLWKADLTGANLHQANLSNSWLDQAFLGFTDLIEADLSHARLRIADLTGANLTGANLDGANLGSLDLNGDHVRGPDLSYAKLKNAKISQEQLSHAWSLKGATMPDGSKHP